MTKLNKELRLVIEDYHNQGLPIIPLNGKVAVVKNWQNITIHDFNIRKFANCISAGMVIPSGWLIIDVDNHGNENGTKSLKKLSDDLEYGTVVNLDFI